MEVTHIVMKTTTSYVSPAVNGTAFYIACYYCLSLELALKSTNHVYTTFLNYLTSSNKIL